MNARTVALVLVRHDELVAAARNALLAADASLDAYRVASVEPPAGLRRLRARLKVFMQQVDEDRGSSAEGIQ